MIQTYLGVLKFLETENAKSDAVIACANPSLCAFEKKFCKNEKKMANFKIKFLMLSICGAENLTLQSRFHF